MKTNKKLSKIAGLFIALLVAFSFSTAYAWSPWKKTSQSDNAAMGITKSSGGDVTVDLTPTDYANGKLTIRISINTHTVNNLGDYDLKKITTLTYGSTAMNPDKTPRLGGHHNSGNLVFMVPELPERFAINIAGLDNVDSRDFVWP